MKKTAHFVLAMRVVATEEDEDEYNDGQEDFEYESDPEDSNIINLGNWDRKQGAGIITQNEYSESEDDEVHSDEEEDDEGNDEENDNEDGMKKGDDNEDEDGERSVGGFGELMEKEAQAAGMTSIYDKNKARTTKRQSKSAQHKQPFKKMTTRRGT